MGAPATVEELEARRRSGSAFWVSRQPPSGEIIDAARAEEGEWLAALPGHVHALHALFAAHDAFDLIAGFLLAQSEQGERAAPQRDPFLDGLMAGETAAMVLLERPGRPATGTPQRSLEQTVRAALPHLRALTAHTGSVLSRMRSRPPGDTLARMQERFIRQYLFVPINDTDEQSRAWLREAFAEPDVQSFLREKIGFTVKGADRLITAAHELVLERAATRAAGASGGIGSLFTFSAAELASRAEMPVGEANAFCKLMSQRFGQPQRTWPVLPTPLRHRPLIDDGRGEHVLVAPALLRRGLRATLAAQLNPAMMPGGREQPRIHQRYLARRGELLEARALQTIGALLKPARAFRSVQFRFRDGTRLEGEIDGLLFIEQTAIVLQAKSAPTRIDAVAADSERFAEVLRSIVLSSMRQHDDARRALTAEPSSVEFWQTAGGQRVPVELAQLDASQVLPITVTLENLSGCAPAAWELRAAGLATAGQLPWIVGVTPLEVMISLLHFSAQLVHFLHRRSLLNETRNLEVIDETDIFLEYLNDHLAIVYGPTEHEGAPIALMPPERFHALDDWLRSQRDDARKVKPPRDRLNRGLRLLLERLERDQPASWLKASVAALDGTPRVQETIGAAANRVFAGRAHHTIEGLTYVDPAGEPAAFLLIGEPRNRRLDDRSTTEHALAQARREDVHTLYLLAIPEDHTRPVRTLFAGPVSKASGRATGGAGREAIEHL